MEMKELYTSPEVKLINFRALEKLATETSVDVDYTDSAVDVHGDDIALDLFL